MDEYISREEAVKKIKSRISTANDAWECGYNTAMGEIMELIKHIPAADVEPMRHGRWIATNDENKKRCSECDIIHLIAQYPHGKANYCPNCGAKMDGDADA